MGPCKTNLSGWAVLIARSREMIWTRFRPRNVHTARVSFFFFQCVVVTPRRNAEFRSTRLLGAACVATAALIELGMILHRNGHVLCSTTHARRSHNRQGQSCPTKIACQQELSDTLEEGRADRSEGIRMLRSLTSRCSKSPAASRAVRRCRIWRC